MLRIYESGHAGAWIPAFAGMTEGTPYDAELGYQRTGMVSGYVVWKVRSRARFHKGDS